VWRLQWPRIFPQGKAEEEPERPGTGLRVINISERARAGVRAEIEDRPRSLLAKSIADRGLALLLILIHAPLLALIVAAIRITSQGPVIYRQVRIGMNRRSSYRMGGRSSPYYDVYDRRTLDLPGRPFIIYKFRTMVDRAEDGMGPVWAQKNDPRVTFVGRLLRRCRLDELPQLFNILKGDMSLVGPRPERPTFVRDLIREIPEYSLRLRVKPGITGLAQVRQAYDTCLSDVRMKLQHDLEYVRNLSLWNDFLILLRTVGVVLSMKGH
jgi:lipopolysaccharide/colanic/teichoic acid biosynthesis glycosyltransferase